MEQSIYKTTDINNDYQFEKLIGEGSYGSVYKAIHKKTRQQVAVKVIDKKNLDNDDQLAIQSEIDILRQIDHPNVIKLFEAYNFGNKLYIVLELMTGGELFDRIVEKDHFSEQEACEVIKPLVDAISYCHQLGVAHRDLKPENILYSSPDKDATIKISDFGLAKVITNEQYMTTACGTPSYIAPEIIAGMGYTFAVDYWSIGILLYVLLCGFTPFQEDNNEKLFEQIKNSNYQFPSPDWDVISESAKDLIKNLLTVNPKIRFNAEKIFNHPWIKGQTVQKNHLPLSIERIRKINIQRKFKKAQFAVIASNRLKNLLVCMSKK